MPATKNKKKPAHLSPAPLHHTTPNQTDLEVLAGDASRQEVEELVLHLRYLVRPHEQLQHLLQLVKEDDLLARASPGPEPDEALID